MDGSLILVAEDEPAISEIVVSYLEREGFRTITASDGEVCLTHHAMLKPDLVILDVNMPRMDGFSVLAEIRKRGGTPVIMATARSEDFDKLSALRIGADDYVVKPFNPVELVWRARAVLRRCHGPQASEQVVRFGCLALHPDEYQARVLAEDGEAIIDLTLTEFRLLAHMIRAPKRAFSRGELVDACLPERDALDRTVDSHISNLRRKLERAGTGPICGVVRGVGYRLASE